MIQIFDFCFNVFKRALDNDIMEGFLAYLVLAFALLLIGKCLRWSS